MAILFSRFIGVEVSPHKSYPFTFAALDDQLQVRALDRGGIDDVYAFLAGQENALAAINSPIKTNKELVKRERISRKLNPKSHLGRSVYLRLVEYELLDRGIRVPKTYADRKKSPRWMQLGFTLVDELKKLGYAQHQHHESFRQFFECQGEAAFWNLLGHAPLEKGTLEGCLQRQVVLKLAGLQIQDGMRFFEEITRFRLLTNKLPLEDVFSGEELNALVAAYTAFLCAVDPEKITRVGDEEEGQVYLPMQAVEI